MSETGWIFSRILTCTVKHLESSFNNIIALGKRTTPRPFKTCLQTLFRYNIRDLFTISPALSTECVPASIIMKFLFESKIPLNRVSGQRIKQHLRCLNYRGLLSHFHTGIKISDFHLLEKMNVISTNTPLLLSFPFLKNFKGLSLNCYKITYHTTQKAFTIYPRHLSVHHSDPAFYQVDFLLDSDVIRSESCSTDTYDHVLLILHLPRLVSFLSTKHNKNRIGSAQICRQCMSLYFDMATFRLHSRSCKAFGPGNLKRRISQNRFIHKTTIFNQRLQRHVPHTLHFDTKSLHKLYRPFTFFTADFESTNEHIDSENRI